MKETKEKKTGNAGEKRISITDVKGTPFDNTFRTLLERCRKLIIPVINEVFGTKYSGDEEVEILSNEHFIVESPSDSVKRVTDSCIKICNRIYHIECETNPTTGMEIRMMEYDFHIALSEAMSDSDGMTLRFPQSVVLFLRDNANTPDKLTINLIMPDEKVVSYEVKTVKVQKYTKEEIFEKDLLFFIPFYVLRFEKKLKEIESFSEIRKEFRETYEDILKHLKNLEKMKYIDYNYFIQLKTLTTMLITIVSRNNPSVVEEVEFMGGGQVIDAEAVLLEELKKTWIKAGLQEGREAGLQEGREAGLQEGREAGLQEGREAGLQEGREAGLQEGREAGLQEGREKGLEQGFSGTIKSCQDLGGSKEQVKKLLIKNYSISEEAAKTYIEKYW